MHRKEVLRLWARTFDLVPVGMMSSTLKDAKSANAIEVSAQDGDQTASEIVH